MILSKLRRLIKFECNLISSNDLDEWIDSLINQKIQEIANRTRRYKHITIQTAIVATADAQSIFALPANFISEVAVEFRPATFVAQDNSILLTQANEYMRLDIRSEGRPAWYILTSTGLRVVPNGGVLEDDSILLTYRAAPSELTAETDENPIPATDNEVIQHVVSRVTGHLNLAGRATMAAEREQLHSMQKS